MHFIYFPNKRQPAKSARSFCAVTFLRKFPQHCSKSRGLFQALPWWINFSLINDGPLFFRELVKEPSPYYLRLCVHRLDCPFNLYEYIMLYTVGVVPDSPPPSPHEYFTELWLVRVVILHSSDGLSPRNCCGHVIIESFHLYAHILA